MGSRHTRADKMVYQPHCQETSRTKPKNVIPFLEEIGRAQIRKSKEHFSLVSL